MFDQDEPCLEEVYAEVVRMRNAAWKAKRHLEAALEDEPIEAVRAILASVKAYSHAAEMVTSVAREATDKHGTIVGTIVHLSSIAATAGLLEAAADLLDRKLMEQE